MTAPDLSPAELIFLDRPYAPESLVERVAIVICNSDAHWWGWAEASEDIRDDYRRSAQLAINAMKGERL